VACEIFGGALEIVTTTRHHRLGAPHPLQAELIAVKFKMISQNARINLDGIHCSVLIAPISFVSEYIVPGSPDV